MKKKLMKSIVICFLGFASTYAFSETETYQFDPKHSFVQWTVDHLGFSSQTGKWPVEGTLTLDSEKPKEAKVNATILIDDLITGNSELNQHLAGNLFFDSKKFPTATFESQNINLLSKKVAKVKGTLTLRGVTKPVTLYVTLNKMGKNPVNDKITAGFSATTEIKRSDFGVNGFIPLVSDDVKLKIDVEAAK